MNWLRMFAPADPAPASFLEGRVGFAVGDVHGRADLLSEMFDMLESRAALELRDAGPAIVVFLGDYVDRGRESARVLDLLLENRPHGFERYCLRGNHEQAMLAFIEAPNANRAWVRHGGAETLLAYGVTPPSLLQSTDEEFVAAAEALKANIPPAHHAFLESLERYVVLGDYAFVHAGIDPARAIEDQIDADLYWSRERFLNSKRRFSHRVVHGHTVVAEPFADARRVAVDTGAYASGVLTAARFEGTDVSFHAVQARA